MKFFECAHCGNVVYFMKPVGVPVECCGETMAELTPNVLGAAEKHIPIVSQDGRKVTVKVSTVEHPMVETHYIEWIIVETEHGFLCRYLKPGDAPRAEFCLPEGERVVKAYDYCNLHKLWET